MFLVISFIILGAVLVGLSLNNFIVTLFNF